MNAATCALSTAGAVTTVSVNQKRTVCYQFNTTTDPGLKLPYAVAVNGQVIADHIKAPRSLQGSRKIELQVDAGSRVALYLNSDALPAFRSQPVYQVEVKDNDVHVQIQEKKGRHPDVKPVVGHSRCVRDSRGRNVDAYEAQLTGDIWMLISHRYTWDEVKPMLPADVPLVVETFLRRLYTGFLGPTNYLEFPAKDDGTSALRITVRFIDSDNVKENTSNCPLLSGVLPRTHPRAYLALLNAAYACSVTQLQVSSTWRPMLGAINHRVGLGIDVDYMESKANHVHINRASLTNPSARGDAENVTAEERKRYREYESAKVELDTVARALDGKSKQGAQNVADSDSVIRDRKRRVRDAMRSWEDEIHANEPVVMNNLRVKLSADSNVSQLFDPWYMDADTRDSIPARANEQVSKLELAHNNHLHITVAEPQLP